MNYDTVIDREASNPILLLTCPDCGSSEHPSSTFAPHHVIYVCGHVRYAPYPGDEWIMICPCPTPLIGALQAVANCGNTCLICQREISDALELVGKAAAK